MCFCKGICDFFLSRNEIFFSEVEDVSVVNPQQNADTSARLPSPLFYGVGISQRRRWTFFPHQIELTNTAHGLCISAVECVFFPLWEVEDVCVVNP